jgi:hypothetical protein
METKRKNWKRSRKRLCKLETGRKRKPRQHGNERLEKTVSRFHGRRVAKKSFRAIQSWKLDRRAPLLSAFTAICAGEQPHPLRNLFRPFRSGTLASRAPFFCEFNKFDFRLLNK